MKTMRYPELWKKFENHILNEGLSEKRRVKLRMVYRLVTSHLNLETATRENIEDYINKLNHNIIKKTIVYGNKKTEYSGSTKSDIKKFLKQFYKWYKGNNEEYPREVSWIKSRIAKDEKPEEKPIIELNDVVKLANSFVKYDYKMLTLMLFDSGFRIQEMMSVKKKDLSWAEFDSGKKCFWLRCNKSKTFARNIPVPLFTPEVKAFFESSYFVAKDNDSPLFGIEYKSYSMMLKKHSLELFRKPLTPHCLRHSSATYYAKEYSGNVPLLAQRYGWSYAAVELQTYVRNSGAYNREGAKISFKNEIVTIKEENEELKEAVKDLSQKMKVGQEQNKKLMDRLVQLEKTEKQKNELIEQFEEFLKEQRAQKAKAVVN